MISKFDYRNENTDLLRVTVPLKRPIIMCHDSNIEWPVKSTRKEKHIINIPSCENERAIKV